MGGEQRFTLWYNIVTKYHSHYTWGSVGGVSTVRWWVWAWFPTTVSSPKHHHHIPLWYDKISLSSLLFGNWQQLCGIPCRKPQVHPLLQGNVDHVAVQCVCCDRGAVAVCCRIWWVVVRGYCRALLLYHGHILVWHLLCCCCDNSGTDGADGSEASNSASKSSVWTDLNTVDDVNNRKSSCAALFNGWSRTILMMTIVKHHPTSSLLNLKEPSDHKKEHHGIALVSLSNCASSNVCESYNNNNNDCWK